MATTSSRSTWTSFAGWVVAFLVVFAIRRLVDPEGDPLDAAAGALVTILIWVILAWVWGMLRAGSRRAKASSLPAQGDPAAAKRTLPATGFPRATIHLAGSDTKAPPAAFPEHLVVGATPQVIAESRAHRAQVREAVLDGDAAEFRLDGRVYETDIAPLGTLRVPNGVVGAADPFVGLTDPIRIPVPPGTYPVHVTTATHLDGPEVGRTRNAYLTVRIAQGRRALVRTVADDEGNSVLAGSATVAFVDADAVRDAMPADEATWEVSPYAITQGPAGHDGQGGQGAYGGPGGHGWRDLLDDPDAVDPMRDNTVRREEMLNVTMPRATRGENVVMASAGDDGRFSCLVSEDADGRVLDITIDLGVIDVWG